jgi:hypothetical protein
MTDHKEITDPKALKEIEALWTEWVEYEKRAIGSIHVAIMHAKSPIQNPCTLTKEDIAKFITESSAERKKAFESSQKEFGELFNKTFAILKNHCLSR